MKEVAILLLAALMLSGCGNSTTQVQQSAAGTWQAALNGGEGDSTGFSFNTQFTVGGDGALSISYFQFLNSGEPCFPFSGEAPTGSMILNENLNTFGVTGTFTFVVKSGSNTLTLTSKTVTGTESGTTLSGITINGNWTLAGDGTKGCNNTSGSFVLTQSSST
jgi:hypothetical protein